MIVTPQGITIGAEKPMLLDWKWLAFAADSVFHLQGVGKEYSFRQNNDLVYLKWDIRDEKDVFKGSKERKLSVLVRNLINHISNEFTIDLSSIPHD